MAGPNLPTNRTTASSIADHVADHNAAHNVVNKIDKDAVPATGNILAWNGTVYVPVVAPAFHVTGAVGDGTGDGISNLAIIQAAIDSASTAGGGIVYVPAGTFIISGRLDVKANVTLRGAGMTVTILKSHASASNPTLRLRGDNDVTVEDLTVDVNSRTSTIGVIGEPVSTATVATRHAVRRIRIRNSTNHALRTVNPLLDFTMEGCLIQDCTTGVSFFETATQSKNIRVVENRWRNVGANVLQISGSTIHSFAGVLFADNDLRDFATPATAIPIEVNYTDGAIVRGNVIGSAASRGISTSNNYGLVIDGNTIKDQTTYAIELGNSKRFTITGNTAENCAAFVHETAAQAEDGVIAANTIVGTGATGTVSGGNTIKLPWARRVRISNNTFTDWQYLREAIRIGEGGSVAEDVVIEGNTFITTDANTPLSAINVRRAIRSSVVRNAFRVERNLVAGDDYLGPIVLTPDAASGDILIDGNEIIFTGTVAAATNAGGITNNGNVAAAALPGTTIRRNHIIDGPRGIRQIINSTDLIVESNDTRTCVAANVIPITAATDWWLRPTYKTGSYYFCNSAGGSATSITLTNGTVRLSPWIVTAPISVVRIGAEFTIAGDAASVFRIGIFADDGFGAPALTTPLLDAGSISTGSGNAGTVATGGTPGVYEITVSITLQPGIYWVGGVVQGVTTTQPTMRVVATAAITFSPPSASIFTAGTSSIGYQMAGVTGALSAWSGASLSGSAPRIFFKTA